MSLTLMHGCVESDGAMSRAMTIDINQKRGASSQGVASTTLARLGRADAFPHRMRPVRAGGDVMSARLPAFYQPTKG